MAGCLAVMKLAFAIPGLSEWLADSPGQDGGCLVSIAVHKQIRSTQYGYSLLNSLL